MTDRKPRREPDLRTIIAMIEGEDKAGLIRNRSDSVDALVGLLRAYWRSGYDAAMAGEPRV